MLNESPSVVLAASNALDVAASASFTADASGLISACAASACFWSSDARSADIPAGSIITTH